jgi:hypothetical protein
VKNPTHGGAGHPCFTPALPRQQSPTPGSVAAGFTPMTTTSTGRSFASSPVRSAAENEKSCIWTAGGEPSNDPSEYRYRRMIPGDASSVSTPSTTIAWSAPLIASRRKTRSSRHWSLRRRARGPPPAFGGPRAGPVRRNPPSLNTKSSPSTGIRYRFIYQTRLKCSAGNRTANLRKPPDWN